MFVFPQSLNIARTPRKNRRHLYENEALNVRVPYMRSCSNKSSQLMINLR